MSDDNPHKEKAHRQRQEKLLETIRAALYKFEGRMKELKLEELRPSDVLFSDFLAAVAEVKSERGGLRRAASINRAVDLIRTHTEQFALTSALLKDFEDYDLSPTDIAFVFGYLTLGMDVDRL